MKSSLHRTSVFILPWLGLETKLETVKTRPWTGRGTTIQKGREEKPASVSQDIIKMKSRGAKAKWRSTQCAHDRSRTIRHGKIALEPGEFGSRRIEQWQRIKKQRSNRCVVIFCAVVKSLCRAVYTIYTMCKYCYLLGSRAKLFRQFKNLFKWPCIVYRCFAKRWVMWPTVHHLMFRLRPSKIINGPV